MLLLPIFTGTLYLNCLVFEIADTLFVLLIIKPADEVDFLERHLTFNQKIAW